VLTTVPVNAASTPPVKVKLPVVRCKVPLLRGHTVRGAKRLLEEAHCTLGKVKSPFGKRSGTRIVSQGDPRGRTLQKGSSVSVTLGRKHR
jgi:beta-lactam-binding protein with PASTA domain